MNIHKAVFAMRLIAFLLSGSVASYAPADVVAVSGEVELAQPPANIGNNQWTNFDKARVWFEHAVTLQAPLSLSHINPGPVSLNAQLVSGQLAAGTAVESYMVRFDPGGNNGVTRSGTVTFNSEIRGVIVDHLGATDALLGRPGVTYNANNNRGMELGEAGHEEFEISANRRTLSFTMYVLNAPTDDMRVVTAPTPAGCGLADIARSGAAPGADGLLDNNDFILFIDRFFGADLRADLGRTGGIAGGDGVFDNNDFIVFIDWFFAGCG